MSKKRQTTGMPKAKPVQPALPGGAAAGEKGKREVASQHLHAEREAELQRNLIRITVGIVGIIVALLAVAFVFDVLIRPNQAVAVASGENISAASFQQRVQIEHTLVELRLNSTLNQYASFFGGDVNQAYQQLTQQEPYATWANEVQFADTLAVRVLDDMVNDKLIAAAAASLGVTVTNEDVEEQLNNLVGYDPEEVANIGVEPTVTPTETITPTPFVSPTPSQVPTNTPLPTATMTFTPLPEGSPTVTPALTITAVPTEITPTLSVTEVQGNYQDQREAVLNAIQDRAGVSRETLLDYFRTQALRLKVAEAVSVQDNQATYVNSRHILVATQEEAQDVLDALNAGESFAALARAVSTDTGSGANGGELGWTAAYQFVEPFADAVTTAEIGTIVGPVESEFGFHIIQVRDREQRDLEESELAQVQQRDFTVWLENLREEQAGNFEIYTNWPDFVPNLTWNYDSAV